MLITKKSLISGKEHTLDLDITFSQYYQVMNKTDHVQRLVPNLSAAEREFLLTGITNDEWNAAFPESDD